MLGDLGGKRLAGQSSWYKGNVLTITATFIYWFIDSVLCDFRSIKIDSISWFFFFYNVFIRDFSDKGAAGRGLWCRSGWLFCHQTMAQNSFELVSLGHFVVLGGCSVIKQRPRIILSWSLSGISSFWAAEQFRPVVMQFRGAVARHPLKTKIRRHRVFRMGCFERLLHGWCEIDPQNNCEGLLHDSRNLVFWHCAFSTAPPAPESIHAVGPHFSSLQS